MLESPSPPRPFPFPRESTPLKPESDRKASLSRYASHLSSLSRHLDTRAQTLSASQSRLASATSNLHNQQAALHKLELNIRSEMTAFLQQIHTRQLALAKWEQKSARTRQWLSKTLASVKQLVRDADDAREQLEAKQTQLNQLNITLSNSTTQLSNVQAQIEQLSHKHRQLREDAIRITEDKEKLKSAADRIETLDRSLRSRLADLDSRQSRIEADEQRLSRYRQFDALVTPLQTFLDHCAALSGQPAVRASDDPSAAVSVAVSALNELRTDARKIEEKRRTLNQRDNQLSERERALKRSEAAVRSRELIVQREQKRIDIEQRDINSSRRDLELNWKGIESSRTDVEIREEALRTKETAFAQTDLRLQRRESALVDNEKALTRREKSIRRAHASVLAKEKALEAKEMELESERSRLQAATKAVELREGMIETRDLELSARESEHGGRLETLLQKSIERDRISMRNTGRRQILEAAERANPVEESSSAAVPKANGDMSKTPQRNAAGPPPATVRRQLAFDTSSKVSARVKNGETAGEAADVAPARGIDDSSRGNFGDFEMKKAFVAVDDDGDDDSEAAAEQLLPELLGVRSYWKERVERLERLVQSMLNKPWTIKPHVREALESVREGLRTIRKEIDTLAKPQSSSPKEAYISEQATQIRWRDRMKEHFSSVCEVQAGLLISLNREEDEGAQPDMSPPERSGRNIVRSPIEDESSVEATVDATMTGDFTNFTLGGGGSDRDMSSPFQRFRQEMRSSDEVDGGGDGARSGRGHRMSPESTTMQSDTSDGTRIRQSTEADSEDVTRELSSVRGDLDNISGLMTVGR